MPHEISGTSDLVGSVDDNAGKVDPPACGRLHPERNPRCCVASLAGLESQQIKQLSLLRSNCDERPFNETGAGSKDLASIQNPMIAPAEAPQSRRVLCAPHARKGPPPHVVGKRSNLGLGAVSRDQHDRVGMTLEKPGQGEIRCTDDSQYGAERRLLIKVSEPNAAECGGEHGDRQVGLTQSRQNSLLHGARFVSSARGLPCEGCELFGPLKQQMILTGR